MLGAARRSEMWVIKEGINYVHDFDQGQLALIMTTSLLEAKRFRSKEDAELWIDRYGKDLESFRILDDQSVKANRVWFLRRDKRQDRSN
jgi:hypothetical protein